MWLSAIHILSLFSFLIAKAFQSYRSSCRRDVLFKIDSRGARLDSDLIFSGTIQKLSFCAKACSEKEACKTFNYHQMTKACEIISKDKNEAGLHKLSSSNGWNHYQPVAQKGTPRCISKAGDEICNMHEKCVEVCENPKGYKCIQLENVALRKSTIQASTCWNGYSSRAVDGFRYVNYDKGSCTHTCQYGTWWRVDFGKTALIHSVVLTSRGDSGFGFYLSNFSVRIGNSTHNSGDDNTACVLNGNVGFGTTKGFPCRPRLYGRYLYVKTNSFDYLVICELRAWGEFV